MNKNCTNLKGKHHQAILKTLNFDLLAYYNLHRNNEIGDTETKKERNLKTFPFTFSCRFEDYSKAVFKEIFNSKSLSCKH